MALFRLEQNSKIEFFLVSLDCEKEEIARVFVENTVTQVVQIRNLRSLEVQYFIPWLKTASLCRASRNDGLNQDAFPDIVGVWFLLKLDRK